MQTRIAEKAQATAATAMARSQNHQDRGYRNLKPMSSRKLLEGAAEVLLLLSFVPLSRTTEAGLTALFEQRLRRVYEGV
jgi:hypothetical protein